MDQRAAVPRANRIVPERVVRQPSQTNGRLDLRSSELRAVLDFTERLLAITDATAVPSILEGVASLVGADSSTLMRINLRTGQEEAVLWPAARADSAVLKQYAAVSRMHPLRPSLAVQARAGVRRPAPIRISDVLTRRQWRASALYAASHRGIDDQMCVLLAARQHTIQLVVVSRHHGFFTRRQVALLAAAQGHLAAAVQRIGQQRLPALQVAPTVRRVLVPMAIPREADVAASCLHDGSAGLPTGRQRQILALVAQGLTDAQIGRRLGLSSATVSKHLTRSYARLGVPNRAAAVRLMGSADPVLRTG